MVEGKELWELPAGVVEEKQASRLRGLRRYRGVEAACWRRWGGCFLYPSSHAAMRDGESHRLEQVAEES